MALYLNIEYLAYIHFWLEDSIGKRPIEILDLKFPLFISSSPDELNL